MMLRLLLGASAAIASAATPPPHLEGHTDSGAAYIIDMPRQWNGTLLLWSHGYAPVWLPSEIAPRDLKSWLLDQG